MAKYGFQRGGVTKHNLNNENEVINRSGMVKRWAESGGVHQRTGGTE
jgi:hypothetical protein